MAVDGHKPVKKVDDWYENRNLNESDGTYRSATLAKCADALRHRWNRFKREMDARVANYDKLVAIADAEVISPKPDLPNISSGETAGMIRRMARNLVQHTPNVDVICEFDDESVEGIFARYILKSKIIGDEQYSNDMQQNLFASAKTSLTLGFNCVIPVLLQNAANEWYIKYDAIFYHDVFPEPGAKDVRDAHNVFVRRYLTKGDVISLIRTQAHGWDLEALRTMVQNSPPNRSRDSVDHQSKKHHTMPEGYEIITWYSDSGDPFLTFEEKTGYLLRIEENTHPLKWHPVHFLVMEKDENQPLGKSQVELVLGRQEFQDLLLNGAMKMWYRNINPAIIGYGTVNTIPNLSPGKYTNISNPNAKVEAFEVNTQTLLQYQAIATGNASNMVQMIGAADQQMATQGTGGAMSQTPQGVDAQKQMVDITTNNYQKAIENFFSRYCSYALSLYFAELKGVKKVTPTADARKQLINAGVPTDKFNDEGELEVDFSKMATEYWVRVVPGSLVEMEDEKQLRILNELFVPLSQAMPALAAAQNPQALAHATAAMQFIIEKQLELSGSAHSSDLKALMQGGRTPEFDQGQAQLEALEQNIGGAVAPVQEAVGLLADQMKGLQEQMGLQREANAAIMQRLGIPVEQTVNNSAEIPA